MCAARRRGKLWSVAAWLFFLSLLLVLAMSQGGHERLVRVDVDDASRPSPVGPSMGGEEQRLSRVGSRPPCCVCRRRCGGCAPCKPVQVRAGIGIARPLCANYEPVRWKCKCGDAVFEP